MRIAITGASGTIGSATLRRLGADGEHQLGVGGTRRVLDAVTASGVTHLVAFQELDWSPSVDAMTVPHEALSGMRHRDADATPALRRRSVTGAVRDLVTCGPVGQRNRP